MGEKNVSPVCLFLWTKTVWFLGFLKAWPTQALVRLFGDRKCEVGCGVQTGEMAYIVLTSPKGGASRNKDPFPLFVPFWSQNPTTIDFRGKIAKQNRTRGRQGHSICGTGAQTMKE